MIFIKLHLNVNSSLWLLPTKLNNAGLKVIMLSFMSAFTLENLCICTAVGTAREQVRVCRDLFSFFHEL
jgi:hypothetical protein